MLLCAPQSLADLVWELCVNASRKECVCEWFCFYGLSSSGSLCSSPAAQQSSVRDCPSHVLLVLAGSQYPIFRCVHRSTHEEVPESYCDSSMKPTPEEEPCNIFPCPAL